jgi:hypothetical protein
MRMRKREMSSPLESRIQPRRTYVSSIHFRDKKWDSLGPHAHYCLPSASACSHVFLQGWRLDGNTTQRPLSHPPNNYLTKTKIECLKIPGDGRGFLPQILLWFI